MSSAEVMSRDTGLGLKLTGPFTPETIIALKQDTGSGGGSRIVPNDIVRPGGGFNPNSPVSPLSPANNIVNLDWKPASARLTQ